MINPHRFSIGPTDAQIAMLRWGENGRPPALLVHGTGFVADVWDEVARELASTYTVYALDRRGHGASHKPDAYHFLDFAEDVCRVIDALDLRDIYGIGHSAGATDLLLATKLRPGRFTRLFVMEPTVMDPRATRSGGLNEESLARVRGTLRRRVEFESVDFNKRFIATVPRDHDPVALRELFSPAFIDWITRIPAEVDFGITEQQLFFHWRLRELSMEELKEALHSGGGIFERLHREMEENNLDIYKPGPWNAGLEPFPAKAGS